MSNPTNEQELREQIASIQLTVMTPAPVVITLGDSKLTDEIIDIITQQTTAAQLALLTRLEKQAIKDMKKNLGQYGTLVRDSIPLNVIKSERALIEKRMM